MAKNYSDAPKIFIASFWLISGDFGVIGRVGVKVEDSVGLEFGLG